jgi:hypothetical protein
MGRRREAEMLWHFSENASGHGQRDSCQSGIVPEVKLGFAAGFEAGHFLLAGVIPVKQLLGGCVVASDIQFAQQ